MKPFVLFARRERRRLVNIDGGAGGGGGSGAEYPENIFSFFVPRPSPPAPTARRQRQNGGIRRMEELALPSLSASSSALFCAAQRLNSISLEVIASDGRTDGRGASVDIRRRRRRCGRSIPSPFLSQWKEIQSKRERGEEGGAKSRSFLFLVFFAPFKGGDLEVEVVCGRFASTPSFLVRSTLPSSLPSLPLIPLRP